MPALPNTFDRSNPASPGHYSPQHTALLLLDFHAMFVQKNAGPKGVAASNTAAQMRTWAKRLSIPVIHCLMAEEGPVFATGKLGDMFTTVVKTMVDSATYHEPTELDQGGSEGDHLFKRPLGYVSALVSDELREFLEGRGIKSLLLTGLSTSGCVLSTFTQATDSRFVTTVITDACADPEDKVHDVLVETVFPRTGYVVTAREFQEGFETGSA